jgi:hypothetical protein
VEAVSKRFLGRTSRQARLNYLVDTSILAGMVCILLSGLAISTWIALPLGNYTAWVDFHETVSEVTLLLLVFKIAIHWRWVVKTIRRMTSSSAIPVKRKRAVQSTATPGELCRRDFLKLMGMVSVAASLALINTAIPNGEFKTQDSVSQAEDDNKPLFQGTANAQTEGSTIVCSSPCRKGRSCSYPGECRQYADTNGNGRCDFGECT